METVQVVGIHPKGENRQTWAVNIMVADAMNRLRICDHIYNLAPCGHGVASCNSPSRGLKKCMDIVSIVAADALVPQKSRVFI